MAIDVVTTAAASGAGSLSDTLANAASGDTIEFAAGLAGATIDLAATLDIVRNVTIDGDVGGQRITLDGGGNFTDIKVEAGVTAALDGLDIIGGSGQGVGANPGGTPGYTGGNAAGGIYNAGTLIIHDIAFSGDTATGGQGGRGANYYGGGAGGSAAGAIYDASGSLLSIDTSGLSFAIDSATGGSGGTGGYSIFVPGGAGGAGGTQISGGAAIDAASGNDGFAVYGNGGGGGAPGQPGGHGATYFNYFPFNAYITGAGGGGGGGPAFADIGGQGLIYRDTVITNAASGAGSLADVLAHAVDGETIEFAAGLAGATIELAAMLDIVRNVTIDGEVGGQRITLDGGSKFTDIKVEAGVIASLKGLDIVGGTGQGAAGGYASKIGGRYYGNPGGGGGGGVFNAGTLTISDSAFSGDTATGGAGGTGTLYGFNHQPPSEYSGGGAGGTAAGGIYSAAGSLLNLDTITVSFSNNSATGGHGGYGGWSFMGNYTGGAGGAGGTQASGGAPSAPSQGNGGQGGYAPGAGGAAGQHGGYGQTYWGSAHGAGGGGGGGFAFADFGGQGTLNLDIVTTNAASGAGSLADVLAHAVNGETIEFAAGLAGATIELAAMLDITRNVTIAGDIGGQRITLDGGGKFTDIKVEAGVTASLAGLDIIGGSGHGADSFGQGLLYGNPGGNAAGGIYNAGTLTVTDSAFSGDHGSGGSGASGGFVTRGGGVGGTAAGGIYNAGGGVLRIDTTGVSFSSNGATGGHGGVGGPSFFGTDQGGAGGAGGAEISGGASTAPTQGSNGHGTYGGAGGAPGQPGGYGQGYSFYGFPIYGAGGGGGGGFAFADIGGQGTFNIEIVTTSAASGAGSLADTLAHAVGGETIEFAAGLAGATIDLSAELDIVRNVTIDGNVGGQRITLDGGGKFTDIKVEAGVTASLEGLDIIGGSGQGAAGGFVSSIGGHWYGNPGGAAAGGIYNAGTLTIANSALSGDIATGGQGGSGMLYGWTALPPSEYSGGGAGGNAAGGIYNAAGSVLNLASTGVSFTNNSATGGQGGYGGRSYHGYFGGGGGGAGGTQISGGTTTAPASGAGGAGGYAPGVGGAPGQHGGYGQYYSYYGSPVYGGGGGGGGGSAFADIGGQGTINPCFRRGTRILTTTGEVAVEALRPGDLLPTVLGQQPAAVRWIGHRVVDCARHPTPEAVWPVRVAAHAFAPGQPSRDLWLSPDHSVYLPEDGGVLVPVRYLVNGATIAQHQAPRVIYFHVELDRHDVLLAEGLPAESYLDTGNRGAFANGGEPMAAHPDFALAIWQAEACARLAVDGPAVVAARQRLLDRAAVLGWARTADPGLRVLVGGRALEAIPDGAALWLHLPDGAAAVRLLSRSMVPAHLFADATDMRELGLAVTSVALDGEDLALDDPRLAAGWHAPECGLRWTNGAAVLHCTGASLLTLQLAALPQFWVAPESAGETARKAA